LKDLLAFGGLIHTIDKVLELPIGLAGTVVTENLSYLIALAEEGGYLSGEAQAFDTTYEYRPNVTYFVFNSAKALAAANNTGVNKTTLLHAPGYGFAPRVIYSTVLVNGTQIMTALGLPVLVTVQDGDTYLNTAKVNSKDNFISNGVFHVVDEEVYSRMNLRQGLEQKLTKELPVFWARGI
jgi:uncharacterized surface protein with fasciclin (FAS1) repeats